MMTLNSLSSPGKPQPATRLPAAQLGNPKNPAMLQARPALQQDVFFAGRDKKIEGEPRQTILLLDQDGLSFKKPTALHQTVLKQSSLQDSPEEPRQTTLVLDKNGLRNKESGSKKPKGPHQTTLTFDQKKLSIIKPKTALHKQLDAMIASGADLNQPLTRYGKPILHDLAYMGETDSVLKAIRNGARINGRDKQNCTPLHWALKAGHPAIVDILMTAGAETEIEDLYGNKPFTAIVNYREQD